MQPVMTMKNSATLMLVLAGCLLLGACKSAEMASDAGATTAPAVSMEQELVAKNIEAQGGLANLQAVQSLQITGEVYMPAAGMTMPITIYQKRPSMVRAEVSVPAMGMEVVSGYDGEVAWADNPMQGGLQKVTGEQARNTKEQADMDGILVDYAAKGYTVEYAGDVDVKGVMTKKLNVMRPDSSEIQLYLDAETFRQIKMDTGGINPLTGGQAKFETYMSDFKEVGGVMRAHAMEVFVDGELFQTITMSEMKVNVEMDDAMFAYPKK